MDQAYFDSRCSFSLSEETYRLRSRMIAWVDVTRLTPHSGYLILGPESIRSRRKIAPSDLEHSSPNVKALRDCGGGPYMGEGHLQGCL
jgi:hypothetical protein